MSTVNLVAKQKNQIAYRPEDDIEAWILGHVTKERKRAHVVDIAVKFLMAWPAEIAEKVIEKASLEKLKDLVAEIHGADSKKRKSA